jgi:hypothetical protein
LLERNPDHELAMRIKTPINYSQIHIQVLVLDDTRLGDTFAAALPIAYLLSQSRPTFKGNHGLKTLSLSRCGIGSNFMSVISNALIGPSPRAVGVHRHEAWISTKKSSFGNNYHGSDSDGEDSSSQGHNNNNNYDAYDGHDVMINSLETLRVAGNEHIDDACVGYFVHAMRQCSVESQGYSLKHLDLSYTSITNYGVNVLAQLLNDKLEQFMLHYLAKHTVGKSTSNDETKVNVSDDVDNGNDGNDDSTCTAKINDLSNFMYRLSTINLRGCRFLGDGGGNAIFITLRKRKLFKELMANGSINYFLNVENNANSDLRSQMNNLMLYLELQHNEEDIYQHETNFSLKGRWHLANNTKNTVLFRDIEKDDKVKKEILKIEKYTSNEKLNLLNALLNPKSVEIRENIDDSLDDDDDATGVNDQSEWNAILSIPVSLRSSVSRSMVGSHKWKYILSNHQRLFYIHQELRKIRENKVLKVSDQVPDDLLTLKRSYSSDMDEKDKTIQRMRTAKTSTGKHSPSILPITEESVDEMVPVLTVDLDQCSTSNQFQEKYTMVELSSKLLKAAAEIGSSSSSSSLVTKQNRVQSRSHPSLSQDSGISTTFMMIPSFKNPKLLSPERLKGQSASSRRGLV